MKRVMITGIGGAIGVHVFAHIMHNTDWGVVGVDSFKREHLGYFDRITEVCADHPEWRERLEVVSHDLNAPFTKREIRGLGRIDYIINLASRSDVHLSIEDPVPFVQNNVALMLNMLELAREIMPRSFLQFSTDEVYGATNGETAHPEWATIMPSNPYSASKAAQEALAIAWWRSYDVPVIITNTMNNFGEMQGATKYPAMIQTKLENNEVIEVHAVKGELGTRFYLHSRNAADAVLFILTNTEPHMHQAGEIDRPDRYNIVGDIQLDNLGLAEEIAGLMGKKMNYRVVDFHSQQPGHDLHYGLDGKKLADLGWEPPMDFQESMKKTIKWQQENEEWVR